MVRALDARPGHWDLSSLVLISSSGVMWSEGAKEGLLKHNPGMLLVDAFSSSEAIGLGQSISAAGAEEKTAHFALGSGARVITDDGRRRRSGIRRAGPGGGTGSSADRLLQGPREVGGHVHRDGRRAVLDSGRLRHGRRADGSITLLGRGSVCINTGGEKVFPEEVEEALKEHASVRDAVVVGVPDEKFGEAITAVVEPVPGVDAGRERLVASRQGQLAPYKAPKRVLPIDTIGRAPNGKVDYRRMKQYALDTLGLT